MASINTNRSNTHADPPLGSRGGSDVGLHVGTLTGNICWYMLPRVTTNIDASHIYELNQKFPLPSGVILIDVIHKFDDKIP